MNSQPEIKQIHNQILKDAQIRKNLVYHDFEWFYRIYMYRHIEHETAEFQHEIIKLCQDESIKTLVIAAARNSAKSTIVTMAFTIWSIIGKLHKKFVVIFSQTQNQAKLHFKNIKDELENNEILKKELGPFEQQNEWNNNSIVIPKYEAKIIAASSEQSIRGIKYGPHRPQVIICDDIEDTNSVVTQESRDKVFNWFSGEIKELGDMNTKIIVVGNLLHEDSCLMRLKEKILSKKIDGVYREYPICDEHDNPLWVGKYKNKETIRKLRENALDIVSWMRENELKLLPSQGQIIKPSWIKYYEQLPPANQEHNFKYSATGIDPAISQKNTADYTAMVSANVYGIKDGKEIYIRANPVNSRLTMYETLETAKQLSISLGNGSKTELYVEEVGMQLVFIQELERAGFPVKGIKVYTLDKTARLRIISHFIENGTVKFPLKGAELLITQLLGFGKEKHDDLVDAFTLLINAVINKKIKTQIIGAMSYSEDYGWKDCTFKIEVPDN